jgi:large subunit ribosomal protein L22
MAAVINKHLDPAKTAYAKASAIKGSIQKVNLVCRMIVGMKAYEALLQLQFCHKRAAKDLYSVLASAIANAENNHGLDIDALVVSEIKVGKAFALKRFNARARGRGARITKPYSNVTIFVTEKE